jgi:hypothetical protein
MRSPSARFTTKRVRVFVDFLAETLMPAS